MKVLNVAEKPSVAKAVATILSRNQGLRVREGRSRYNKLFEFNYSIRGQHCQMVVTSVIGHLMELEFEDRFRKWHSCDPAHLYHAPVRKFVPEVCFFSSIWDFFWGYLHLFVSSELGLSFFGWGNVRLDWSERRLRANKQWDSNSWTSETVGSDSLLACWATCQGNNQ